MAQRLSAAGHRVTMIVGANELSDVTAGKTGRIEEVHCDGIRVLCVNEPYANRMGFIQHVRARPRNSFSNSTPISSSPLRHHLP